MPIPIERITRRKEALMVPQPVEGESGLVRVDTTWGNIQPAQLADGVQTVGELEVIAHIQQGLPVVDARTIDFFEESTIPTAISIPYVNVTDRVDELSRREPTVFFCNGPQCGQSPTAIRALLQSDFPPGLVIYYRGGLHDWLTLGLPVVPGQRGPRPGSTP